MAKTGIKIIRKNTAREFLNYLRLAEPQWTLPDENKCDWVFRGQADERWKLEPTAMRKSKDNVIRSLIQLARETKKYHKTINQMYKSPDNKLQLSQDEFYDRMYNTFGQVDAESELIYEFVRQCDQAGLAIPEDKTPYRTERDHLWILKSQTKYNSEDVLSHRLERLGRSNLFYSIDVHVQDKKRELFHLRIEPMLAQHYGIPTRLLDWTYNPLVAAYFAASDMKHWHENPSERPKRFAVWAIYRPVYHHSDLWFDQPYTSKIDYLRAQKGLFSVDLTMNNRFINTGTWRTVDQIPIESKENIDAKPDIEDFANSPLVKITLPSSERGELLRLLELEGITEATLKPSFDTIGRFLTKTVHDRYKFVENVSHRFLD